MTGGTNPWPEVDPTPSYIEPPEPDQGEEPGADEEHDGGDSESST